MSRDLFNRRYNLSHNDLPVLPLRRKRGAMPLDEAVDEVRSLKRTTTWHGSLREANQRQAAQARERELLRKASSTGTIQGRRLRPAGGPANVTAPLSPLLRLPPEIRNLIYALAIGGDEIHVYAGGNASSPPALASGPGGAAPKHKVQFYPCLSHASCPGFPAQSHPHRGQPAEQREWLGQHLSCFLQGTSALPNTSLLRTCRQIHREASLFPFSSNTFIFVAPSSLESFLTGTLSPAQAQAIRHLAIWSPASAAAVAPPKDGGMHWAFWGMPGEIRERRLLAGVRALRVDLSVYDPGTAWDDVAGLGRIVEFGRALDGLRSFDVVLSCDGVLEVGDGRIERFRSAVQELFERKRGAAGELGGGYVEEEEAPAASNLSWSIS